ncbi:gas vesicle protein [Salinigranum rubrum]|uniref:Gas vesicle protein n=1 Tax=Salinigranum rubrum TaxID=755307 RepID=A0A2I8VKP3_9EURY|nr:gas vesicle protein GvpO [Salinigranum rubrum]AUV82454.1 gas vesicle protein [Salinigranum rubrum]
MATASDGSRCRARTDDGDRCERTAQDDGFCYQHGPDDPTVDEADGDEETGASEETDGDEETEDGSNDDRSVERGPLVEVRERVVANAAGLVGHPLDNVVAITSRDEGWTATVEVVERTAVPDTQDILGRYELLLDDSPVVTEYRRVGRSRRGDTEQEEQL